MAENAIRKASGGSKYLYRHKSVLGVRERNLLVNALLQPRFNYGWNFWLENHSGTKLSDLY